MIALSALVALVPVVAALPSTPLLKRTPPTGILPPTIQAGPTTFYSRGCYDELKGGQNALQHDITSTLTTLTVESCVIGCQAAGYSIAGLMYGNQCRCDNAMSPDAPTLHPDECNLNCSGDSNQICGGVWHYNIYYPSPTDPIPPPIAPPTVESNGETWTSIGCYVDVVSSRTLPAWVTTADDMTPEKCVAACQAKGYSMAGLEWGRECFCDDTIYNPTLAPESECNQACAGDSTKACGDQDRITIYEQPEEPTEPEPTPTTTTTTTSSGDGNGSTGTTSTEPCTTTDRSPRPTHRPHRPRKPRPQPTCGSNNHHDGYLHQGCYSDNPRRRTLNQYSFSSSNMTPSMCTAKCFSKGFKYAGIENGTDCYCGNNCPSQVLDSHQCDRTCRGDDRWIGGGRSGSGRLTIYKSVTLGYPRRNWPHGWW